MSAATRNFPPAGTAKAACAFTHPALGYVAVMPNRAYGAYAPANDPRPSVRHDGFASMPVEEPSPELGAPTVVAASAAVIAAILLLAAAFYLAVVAPSADGAEPTRAVPGAAYETSTPIADWQQGAFPHLYQNNEAWGYASFDGSTVAEAGSAPTSLCMVYVHATGSHAYTPAGFASYGNEHGLGASTIDEAQAYLDAAAGAFGLACEPVEADELALRHALAQGSTVIAVIPATSSATSATAMVVEGVNQDSALSVLNPASPGHTPEAWSFSDLLQSAGALVALQPSAA